MCRIATIASISFGIKQKINILCARIVIVYNAKVLLGFVMFGPQFELLMCLIANACVQKAQSTIEILRLRAALIQLCLA